MGRERGGMREGERQPTCLLRRLADGSSEQEFSISLSLSYCVYLLHIIGFKFCFYSSFRYGRVVNFFYYKKRFCI